MVFRFEKRAGRGEQVCIFAGTLRQRRRAAGADRVWTAGDLRGVGIEQQVGAALPLDTVFKDDHDQAVTLRQYTGKPLLLALVYYKCPSLCDLVLNGAVRSLKGLKFTAGKEFEVVAVSFDPAEGVNLAAEKKVSYVKAYGREGGEKGLHFLTGNTESIKRLADAVGFHYVYDPSTGQFAHSSGIIIGTPEGKVNRYFYGVEYPARDVKLGLMDAASGKIGSPLDQLQLFCFHYDPAVGKYGLLIMNVLRLGGILTLVLLVGSVVMMTRGGARA